MTEVYREACSSCEGHGHVASPDSIRQGHTHSNDPDLHVIECAECAGEGYIGPMLCKGCDADVDDSEYCTACDGPFNDEPDYDAPGPMSALEAWNQSADAKGWPRL